MHELRWPRARNGRAVTATRLRQLRHRALEPVHELRWPRARNGRVVTATRLRRALLATLELWGDCRLRPRSWLDVTATQHRLLLLRDCWGFGDLPALPPCAPTVGPLLHGASSPLRAEHRAGVPGVVRGVGARFVRLSISEWVCGPRYASPAHLPPGGVPQERLPFDGSASARVSVLSGGGSAVERGGRRADRGRETAPPSSPSMEWRESEE